MNIILKKTLLSAVLGGALLTSNSCGLLKMLDEKLNGKTGGQNLMALAMGLSSAPSGQDVLSSTTNHSKKVEDPETKARGTMGAAFIKPPAPNNYGAVSLSYPIEIPAGRAGMQPSLALSYSSSGGDGWTGIGWNIGLGGITRTTQYGQPHYDGRDVFTFGGKRLVKVSGSTTNENGIYRTEIASGFARLELTNIENGGIWTVYDSGGTVTVYGETRDSRCFDPANDKRTYSWYYKRATDRNGNFMEAEYDSAAYAETGVLYLKEIRYTGNVNSGQSARQYVRFHTRKRDDAYVSKAPGWTMKMNRLLERIEIGWDQGQLWDYKMVYETSADSGRPLLKTVDSSRVSTKPEFIYQPANHYLAWQKVRNTFASAPEINPLNTRYFEGDFNGDGISDMVFFNPENGNWSAAEGRRTGGYNFKLYGNKFGGFRGESKIQFFKGNVTGDYNGDARADIAMFLPETKEFWIAEHDGRVFQFRKYGTLHTVDFDIFKAEWFPGDFDGNGISDIVLFHEPTGEWVLMRNAGGRFEFQKYSVKFKNLFRGDYSPDANRNGNATTDNTPAGKDRSKVVWLSGDYNGDGRTDFSFYDKRNGEWWVGENRRDDHMGFTVDWKLYKVFTAPEQTLFGFDRFSGDYNGDGLSDFLLFDRAKGEWIIGETTQPVSPAGNPTINFRVYSKAPQFKAITRWLRGDFNGDGRTDIGFFSKTDNNIWVGEATPNGFRYRIYNNLSNGPGTSVLDAPMPRDEVKPAKAKAVFPGETGKSVVLDYSYDGNTDTGEIAFPGCFYGDCSTAPQYLLFERRSGKLNIKSGTADPTHTGLDPPLAAADTTLLSGGGPAGIFRRPDVKDELRYYRRDASGSPVKHKVHRIHYGTGFQDSLAAEFTDAQITNFKQGESVLLVDDFLGTGTPAALVLDDQNTTPANAKFNLVTGTTVQALNHTGALQGTALSQLFREGTSGANRAKRPSFSFFSGKFLAGSSKAAVLMVDRRAANHKWYLGEVTAGDIAFTEIAMNAKLKIASYQASAGPAGTHYYVRKPASGPHELVYAVAGAAGTTFHRVSFGASPAQTDYPAGTAITYKNEFDHAGDPIVYNKSDGAARRYEIASATVKDLASSHVVAELKRPDLYTKVYPFRWVQGDYNGDGKTDIGIFHLKSSEWYFANTTGTVPDLIHKIKNGIGGTYTLTYENSTRFDNTGADDIPDLPMNYKVCTRIVQEDGVGNTINLNYEYSGGYAFNAYINGRKESDAFGFSRFVKRDAHGHRTISVYNNVPHSNYLLNRALAGAIKSTTFLGKDNQQYSRSEHDYQIHTISESGQTKPSYLITPAAVRKYVTGVLVETKTQSVGLAPGRYELLSRTASKTDHYTGNGHSAVTIASVSNFETVQATNQQRLTTSVSNSGTAHEETTTLQYDAKGNQIRKTLSYTGSGLAAAGARVSEYSYDALGNVTETRDVSASPSRITKYEYDSQLKQFKSTQRQVTDAGELVTSFQINYGSAFGQPEVVTDANGKKAYSDFDSLGRLSASRADAPGGTKTLQTFSYSSRFPLSAKTVFHSGTGDPDVQFRFYTDGLGRDIHRVRSATNGRFIRSGRLVYDAVGRVIRTSRAAFVDAAEIDVYRVNLTERDPTVTKYDPSGRVLSVTSPKAAGESKVTSVSTTYNDPWEVIVTHSIGRSKRTVKNARGLVVLVEDSGTGDLGQSVSAKLGFCYNIRGQRTKKMDLNGVSLSCSGGDTSVPAKDVSGNNIAWWSYDGLGRMVGESDPDRGVTSMEFNAFGDMVASTDARGLRTTMAHDRLGRMITKTLPASEGAVHYQYDSHPSSENGAGRLTAMDDPASTKVFSYDELGRRKLETRTLKFADSAAAQKTYRAEYRHDLMNRIIEIDYPRKLGESKFSRVCYGYNELGYAKSVHTRTDGSIFGGCTDAVISSMDYNEFGQVSSTVFGNGITRSYAYDVKNRLKTVHAAGMVGGVLKTIQSVNYTFNVQDSIKQVSNTADDYQTDYVYKYDGINRLVDATGMYVESFDGTGTTQTVPSKFHRGYAYTANGNLSRKDFKNPDNGQLTDQWNYIYSNHMATRIDSTSNGAHRFTMTYDTVGNMSYQKDSVTGREKNLFYDSYNRVRSVLNPVSSETVGEYWYDDQGFRVRKKAKLDQNGELKNVDLLYPCKFFGVESTDSGSVSYNHIYLNGLRIAAMDEGGTKVFFMSDAVDSVRLVLDANGGTVTRTEHMPYGETFVQKGNKDFAPKYNSQELDRETGHFFYNARYYDPKISRFTTADSVIDGEFDPAGWNRFAYVKGNPIRYKDPDGHQTNDGKINEIIKQAGHIINGEGIMRGVARAGVNLFAGALNIFNYKHNPSNADLNNPANQTFIGKMLSQPEFRRELAAVVTGQRGTESAAELYAGVYFGLMMGSAAGRSGLAKTGFTRSRRVRKLTNSVRVRAAAATVLGRMYARYVKTLRGQHRPTMVSVLITRDWKVYFGRSIKEKLAIKEPRWQAYSVLRSFRKAERKGRIGRGHTFCGEPECVTQAILKNADLEGAVIQSIMVGNQKKFGACASCRTLLKDHQVIWFFQKNGGK